MPVHISFFPYISPQYFYPGTSDNESRVWLISTASGGTVVIGWVTLHQLHALYSCGGKTAVVNVIMCARFSL